jgi:nucleoside-diphosphate-sugar epimerase
VEDVVSAATDHALARDLDAVLVQSANVWPQLRGARIFLTGGSGFFGRWLLESLLWANARARTDASVVVLTRDPDRFQRAAPRLAADDAVTLHGGDVRTFEFPDGRFSHVIHAAVDAVPPRDRDDRLRVFDVIVEGTRRTLEFARRAGAPRYLFASSGAVYGRQPSGMAYVPEEYAGGPDPTDPARAGAEAKRAAETLCAIHSGADLEPLIARCFAFVGPYLPLEAHFAIGNFIADALSGRPVEVTGDGTPVRSYLYASDLAVWLWTVLARGVPLRPYNIGSEDAISIADAARSVARCFSPAPDVRIAREPAAEAPDRYVPSTARIRGELGVRPTVGFRDALARTVDWYRRP